MKNVILASLALLPMLILADEATAPVAKRVPRRLNRAEVMAAVYRHTGGKIKVPGSQKGKIVFVNAQKAMPVEWVNEVATNFAHTSQLAIELKDGQFQFPNPKIEGEASLYVIDDANMPPLLHAPESRWTMINVARLKDGDGAKPAFYHARCMKELTRGFCLLAGAQKSNYPESILCAVTQPSDLDRFEDWRLPVDIPERFKEYLDGLGIRPYVLTTYKKACEQGWAPAPTNEVLKVIWDKVHAPPEKPLKITYDKAAQKPVVK